MRLHVKSQYGMDYRRYSIVIGTGLPYPTMEEFSHELYCIHKLNPEQCETATLSYQDKDGSSLPLSNDDNLRKALNCPLSVLRITVRSKGESYEDQYGYGLTTKSIEKKKKRNVSISAPQDFRRVSSILDADILPMELRRVQLCKTYTNKPLGFFIRDGNTHIWTSKGPMMSKGIFISRLIANGIAASTNLLNVDDEILEVNGIGVADKTLDQVADIMLANASNMILTIRPSYPDYPHHILYPNHYSHPSPYRVSEYWPSMPPMQPSFNHFGENEPCLYSRPVPMNFSRHSTYRLSDSKSSKKLPESPVTSSPRRPLSMHPMMFYSSPFGVGY